MCGRFVLATPPEELARLFDATVHDLTITSIGPSWNVPPTASILAVTANASGARSIGTYRWGLVPPWAKDLSFGANTINARSESMATKPSFRVAFRSKRCIIPADGYYEWKTTAGEVKQPYYFTRTDGRPLAIAGLWERYLQIDPTDSSEREVFSCAIVTTEANHEVAAIHTRMPAILEPGDAWGRWLDSGFRDEEELLAMCAPAVAGTLIPRRVSSRVNSVRNNGAELIDELLDRPSLF
jgi:putative SOS response-associated peptidase YedK